MSNVSTRSRTKPLIEKKEVSKGRILKDKDLLSIKDKGLSAVLYFYNGKKEFVYQYDLDNENEMYNSDLLLNNSQNITPAYIQSKIRQMMKREYEIDNIDPETDMVDKQNPKRDVRGICRGDVGQAFMADQYKKEANDTKILLIDHAKQEYVGYIIARREQQDKDRTYYIDIICTEPGYGGKFLSWFINFFTSETTNKESPSYGITSLSLSALSSVLTFYPKQGYLHVKNCEENEEKEIRVTRDNLPKHADGKKPNRSTVEFINFLFLLTRKGYNATENPICEFISQSDINNDMNQEDVNNYIRFRSIDTQDKYKSYMLDLEKRRKSKAKANKEDAEEAQRLYDVITGLRKTYENAYQSYTKDSTDENKKSYFDATYNFAKYLYLYVGGCDNNGYYQKKCLKKPQLAFENYW